MAVWLVFFLNNKGKTNCPHPHSPALAQGTFLVPLTRLLENTFGVEAFILAAEAPGFSSPLPFYQNFFLKEADIPFGCSRSLCLCSLCCFFLPALGSLQLPAFLVSEGSWGRELQSTAPGAEPGCDSSFFIFLSPEGLLIGQELIQNTYNSALFRMALYLKYF